MTDLPQTADHQPEDARDFAHEMRIAAAVLPQQGDSARMHCEWADEFDRLVERAEAAERERDDWRDRADGMARAPYGEFAKAVDRAEAAEALLAECRGALGNCADLLYNEGYKHELSAVEDLIERLSEARNG